jgi:hypothetical protein
MEKENVAYIIEYSVIKKQLNFVIYRKTDRTGDHVKWNKSDSERQIPYVSSHMWNLEFFKKIWSKIKTIGGGGTSERRKVGTKEEDGGENDPSAQSAYEKSKWNPLFRTIKNNLYLKKGRKKEFNLVNLSIMVSVKTKEIILLPYLPVISVIYSLVGLLSQERSVISTPKSIIWNSVFQITLGRALGFRPPEPPGDRNCVRQPGWGWASRLQTPLQTELVCFDQF